MKTPWTARGLACVVHVVLLAAAARAQLAPLCPAPLLGEFEKTVCVVNAMTDSCDGARLPPLSVLPGELLEYEVIRCNNTGTACMAPLVDNLDGLLSGREDRLTYVDADPATSCTLGPGLGGAICELGPLGGPYVPAPSLTQCGQDCGTPTDTVALAPMPATLLSDGQCYRFVFRAQLAPALGTLGECICNQAQTIISMVPLDTANSRDPSWVTLESYGMEPHCVDAETCPDPLHCTTCVKYETGACCDGMGACGQYDPALCTAFGGFFAGGGTTCVDLPDPCPPPATGACCDGVGGCVETDAGTCDGMLGLYSGDGTACSDVPPPCAVVPAFGDYTGDGIADLFVWRKPSPMVPTTQWGSWYWLASPIFTALDSERWGITNDIPLVGDMDGDGTADPIIWRPSTSQWYWLESSTGLPHAPLRWGLCGQGDTPLVADMDGDGLGDPVVWRTGDVPPVLGGQAGTWYWRESSTGYTTSGRTTWGRYDTYGDRPFLADMDGDGRADPTVWRPGSPSYWYWKESHEEGMPPVRFTTFRFKAFGQDTLGDVPILTDIDGDGLGDLVVFRTSTNEWRWTTSSSGWTDSHVATFGAAAPGDVPLVLCLDADSDCDLVTWRPSDVRFRWTTAASGYLDLQVRRHGVPTDIVPDYREREANTGVSGLDWVPYCNP